MTNSQEDIKKPYHKYISLTQLFLKQEIQERAQKSIYQIHNK